MLACTRCHTVDGVNGMRSVLSTMYGDKTRWDREAIASYIGAMHDAPSFHATIPRK